ncbi:hypothetical protein N7532_003256 [Penicillium argentinense]|uniref:Uncharacterized protein n=1 Tax=Penicillium argentinense TaxID=1131581 RepID=A0A9W9FMK5_9EURO|nr:uncharacterized protein N7532_003256 [Penicillium argentinense]KAJ5102727.1 hypothetical protein N7532_003256 [Penicillium argentinense]
MNETLPPFDRGLRAQGPFARVSIFSAKIFGHVAPIGVFVWLEFGRNRWQLYTNYATSALMTLVFAFLACLRECYCTYTNICTDVIFKLDATLEGELRRLSKDSIPYKTEDIMPPKAIFYYGDVIGTLASIIFLVIVIITWVAVGPVFEFNNPWWLPIGTYAGLVGLFDSFVLRNIQSKVSEYTNEQIRALEKHDMALYYGLLMPIPYGRLKAPSLSQRISRYINTLSSHLFRVVSGVSLTIGCIVASSATRWSLTGQLVSNVPPSIIGTFFMIILITGHNYAEKKMRV